MAVQEQCSPLSTGETGSLAATEDASDFAQERSRKVIDDFCKQASEQSSRAQVQRTLFEDGFGDERTTDADDGVTRQVRRSAGTADKTQNADEGRGTNRGAASPRTSSIDPSVREKIVIALTSAGEPLGLLLLRMMTDIDRRPLELAVRTMMEEGQLTEVTVAGKRRYCLKGASV
jgi:uncharacterized protein YdaT